MAPDFNIVVQMSVMKKVWDLARNMIKVMCVCILFPGVDFDIDNISSYFTNGEDVID
jgi:hypothetical protein